MLASATIGESLEEVDFQQSNPVINAIKTKVFLYTKASIIISAMGVFFSHFQ